MEWFACWSELGRRIAVTREEIRGMKAGDEGDDHSGAGPGLKCGMARLPKRSPGESVPYWAGGPMSTSLPQPIH
jgi:hypothetical protein